MPQIDFESAFDDVLIRFKTNAELQMHLLQTSFAKPDVSKRFCLQSAALKCQESKCFLSALQVMLINNNADIF